MALHALIGGSVTILGGLLALSTLWAARKPNANELIEMLVPYQGWVGLLMVFLGLRQLEVAQTALGFAWLATGVSVGLLLAFGFLSTVLFQHTQAHALRMRLIPVHAPLGFTAIAIGALYLIH